MIVCDDCGGDGGWTDYGGTWFECHRCAGKGFFEYEDELPPPSPSMSPAMADVWERWADNIIEQIGE
jgi:hypothetical protein